MEVKRKLENKSNLETDNEYLRNYKRCPWCTALVERISGCDLMTCTMVACRRKFCYLCVRKMEPGVKCEHTFYH